MSDIIIKTVGLKKVYEAGRIVAVDDIDVEIKRGEFFCVIGPSGSGKTTFLNLIGALDKPTKGEVILDEIELSKHKNLDSIRASFVGYIFQLHNLIPSLTALENVLVPTKAIKMNGRERLARARELLTLVGLGDRMNAIPSKLSGGERQRVSIARALVNNPKVLLADEPTGNLDSHTGLQIINLIMKIKHEKRLTLVMVTHNLKIAANADRVVEMKDGKFYPCKKEMLRMP
jgi:putative ABC transport system ATP-binding protein